MQRNEYVYLRTLYAWKCVYPQVRESHTTRGRLGLLMPGRRVNSATKTVILPTMAATVSTFTLFLLSILYGYGHGSLLWRSDECSYTYAVFHARFRVHGTPWDDDGYVSLVMGSSPVADLTP